MNIKVVISIVFLLLSAPLLSACTNNNTIETKAETETSNQERNKPIYVDRGSEDLSGYNFEYGLDKPIVPNAEAAAKVAQAYFISAYGSEFVEKQLPLNVYFDEHMKIWYIYGTIPYTGTTGGGEMSIFINQKDGKVIAMGLGA